MSRQNVVLHSKIPRMSFEVTSIAYDSQRQLPKLNHFAVTSDNQRADKYYVGVVRTRCRLS